MDKEKAAQNQKRFLAHIGILQRNLLFSDYSKTRSLSYFGI